MAAHIIPPPKNADVLSNVIDISQKKENGLTSGGNPTVLGAEDLGQFHFTFLIRHPKYSIPSYYRCCIPPQSDTTGWHGFDPLEAGYIEIRQLFDYLLSVRQIGPGISKQPATGVGSNTHPGAEICVVDADDLMLNPASVIKAYCQSVHVKYDPAMLSWESGESREKAADAFKKFGGFHDGAINSSAIKPNQNVNYLPRCWPRELMKTGTYTQE
jgi:hypothetical protein